MMRVLITASAVTAAVVASSTALAGSSRMLALGPVHHASQATYVGFYDGHKDTFVVTNTSSKAQSRAMHINYSPELAHLKNLPRQFFIVGRAARGRRRAS